MCVCVVLLSCRWRLLAPAEPRRVHRNRQGHRLRPQQQEVRGGLRDGRHPVRLCHRSQQLVANQRNHGKVQQAAHQVAPQAAAGSPVQRETPGNIMIIKGRMLKEEETNANICSDETGADSKPGFGPRSDYCGKSVFGKCGLT